MSSTEYRVGVMKSTSSPPTVAGELRRSFTDQMSSPVDREGHVSREQESSHEQANSPQPRTNSELQPPSADPTRSSYTTSSIMSPPPQRHVLEHMSLHIASFDQAPRLTEHHAPRTTTTSVMPASLDDSTIGHSDEPSGEGMEELVAALSSHSHSTL
ncbi:hypothetical protein C0995_010487 [Termitomyces sp. Mi166|nr:hypothetical protein C0995_010487 [Termitomyces sp. Mi166\